MKKPRPIIVILGLLVTAYLAVTVGLPADPKALAQYGLSATQAKLLSLTIALPYIITWSAALYGAIKIKDYATKIKKGKEGTAFRIIANALTILALGLPVIAIVRAVLNYVARADQELLPTVTIVNNYFGLLVVLISFTLLYQGAKVLTGTIKKSPKLPHYFAFMAGFSLLSLTYIYLVLSNPIRAINGNDTSKAIYYLPDWLLISTIIVPYLYTWLLGILAAMYIYIYQKEVKGILYRRSLRLLSVGIAFIIGSSVLTQFLTAILNIVLNLRLSALLGVIYILLLLIGIGYVLTAFGARRLQKIEEV